MLFSTNTLLLTEDFHDIVPPVDYSLIPPWAIALAAIAGVAFVTFAIWWLIKRYKQRTPPPPLPRDRALAALRQAEPDVDRLTPYEFSIQVSDILRAYVSEQFGLPVIRQTSFEFLEQVRLGSVFADEEKQLLEAFLDRCDLIKFARYEASPEESHRLLEEAVQFVKGEQLACAPV